MTRLTWIKSRTEGSGLLVTSLQKCKEHEVIASSLAVVVNHDRVLFICVRTQLHHHCTARKMLFTRWYHPLLNIRIIASSQ